MNNTSGRPTNEAIEAYKALARTTMDGHAYKVIEYINKNNVACMRMEDGMTVQTTRKEVDNNTVKFPPVAHYHEDAYRNMCEEVMARLIDEPRFMDALMRKLEERGMSVVPANGVQKFTSQKWKQYVAAEHPEIIEALDYIPTGTRIYYEPGVSILVDAYVSQKVKGTADKKSLDMYNVDISDRWPVVCQKLGIPEENMELHLHLSNHFKQAHFKFSIKRLEDKGVTVDFAERNECLL